MAKFNLMQSVRITGIEVKLAPTLKYLGVILDQDLERYARTSQL
jgi:hypothetical protein